MESIIQRVSSILKEVAAQNHPIETLLEQFKARVSKKFDELNLSYSPADIEEIIKIAWCYEEENVETFSLKQAIEWLKMNLKEEKHTGGCLYRKKGEWNTVLHLCFLGKDGQPLLGPGDCHKKVSCLSLDPSLENQFGTKDLIVFK